MADESQEMQVEESAPSKENDDEYDEDQEKNLDEILDELKEAEDEGDEEDGDNEGGHQEEGEFQHEQVSGEENGDADESKDGAAKEGSEAESKDRAAEEAERLRKEEEDKPIDPSKGFLENEQDKMITGSWKYRMKIQSFNFEARELNQDNIEKLVNLSLSSAIYFFNKGHGSGKKLGKMEIFCSSQTTGELAMERVLRLDVTRPMAVYVMRKVNIEDKELAYIKVMPFHAQGMRFKPLHKVQPGGKASTRSLKVSNIPEGTSDELLQALFPCCINIVKPEEVDGKSPGFVVLECMDRPTVISVRKSYLKVQIGSNILHLARCYESKSATALVDGVKKKEEGEGKAKPGKEGEEKEKKEVEEDEEDEEGEEGEERSEKFSRKTYRPPRGGSSYRPSRGGRYRPYDRYQDRGRSYADRRETEALKDQIAMLQENISMLTQSMNPMMMGGGGAASHGSVSRRQRSDSGRYRDEYATSNRYSSSRDYGTSSYGGNSSWQEAPYSSGGSRKRSYNWDDDYSTSSSRSYKKYY